jgi:hypothetical protein
MTARMPDTTSPREKVARIVDPREWELQDFGAAKNGGQMIAGADLMLAPSLTKADAILAALASSGDHAELKRLADEAADFDIPAKVAPAVLNALIAEVAALRVDNADLREHRITADLLASTLKADKEEAERNLAEAVGALEEIAAIEPKPFDSGLDMEAIRGCEECRRYEGYPVQRGICNTHRRPIWDREKHESREEKALGYRAKSIARTFLSKEAERG